MWLDNENKQDPYNRLNPANTSVGAGGGSVQAGGTSSNPSTQTPVQAPQPEQKFATVQDYLGANQQQGEQLGQNFTNKLGESANQERSTIAGAASQAKDAIHANDVAFDSNIVNTAVNDPTKVANDPGQLDSFLKQWNASYKGPESFEASANYGTAADAATKANEKAEQLKTAGGQQQLLQDEFNVYGQGNKGLDQALLQTSSAFPKVQDQAKEFGTIKDYLGQQAGDVNTAAQATKANVAKTKADTQNPFANKLTDFSSDLNTRVAAKKADAQKVASKYNTDLSEAGKSTGDETALLTDVQDLGASPQEIQTLKDYFQGLRTYQMGGDFGTFAMMNPNTDFTPSNVATSQDYDKAAALQKLTGVDYTGVLNPDNKDKVAPQQAPINVGGLTGYLKGQVAPRDEKLLGGGLNDAFSAINPDAYEFLHTGSPDQQASRTLQFIAPNPSMAKSMSDALIQASTRSKNPGNLLKMYNAVKSDWDNRVINEKNSGRTFNPADKNIAGSRVFLNSIAQYLGKPQV